MTADRPEPRQTLAMRLAERNRQRELRAERLARLRPNQDPADDAEAALEEFLRALAGDRAPLAAPPAPEPGAVLHFQRPEPAPARGAVPGDLDRLPGAGADLGARARRPPPPRRPRAARPGGSRRPPRPARPAGPGPGLDRHRPRRRPRLDELTIFANPCHDKGKEGVSWRQ